MKILVIGNGNHVFIRELYIRIKKIIEIDRLDIYSYPPIKDNAELFDNVYQSYDDNNILCKTKILRIFYRNYFTTKNIDKIPNDYDIIHIHYISNVWGNSIDKIKFKGKKIISTVWGSDFYRSSNKDNKVKYKLYNESHIITTSTDETRINFIKRFPTIDCRKIFICDFGSETLEKLKNIHNEYSKLDSKIIMGFDPAKITISIGYNLNPAQNHIEIIKNIVNDNKLKKFKNSIQFIFPITYPEIKNYKKVLKKYLSRSTLDYILIENYLTSDNMAHLSNASDILIQLQTTDQLSDSMLEYLYAKNILITGEWLPYASLINLGVYYHKISSIDNVGNELLLCLENYDKEKKMCCNNSEIVYGIADWEKNIGYWIALYNSLYRNE